MKLTPTILVVLVGNANATLVPSCPKVSCPNTDWATDLDDWCVRVNIDEEFPALSTVKIRECLGDTKVFCEWSLPGNNQRMIWPYDARKLTRNERLSFFGTDKKFEAKCVDANTYYGRGQFYPGWKCLLDMDCASKKCVKGVCVGRLEDESCNQHRDCISGLYCKLTLSPPVCRPRVVEAQRCDADYECSPGLFCMESGYCERLWYKEDEAVPREVRQCKSNLVIDDRRTGAKCKST